MKLLIVRHGDPNYEIDGLTEKGAKEAELVSKRLTNEKIAQIYCSPLGRARLTAQPTLDKTGMNAKYVDWLREFGYAKVRFPYQDEPDSCWDILPEFVNDNPEIYTENWREVEFIKNSDVGKCYDEVCNELDKMLASHGYERWGKNYRAVKPNHDTIVLFCHFGITAVLLSHLLNCSPFCILQHCVTLPTSVTTVYTEERRESKSLMRMCGMGDISHLYIEDEPPAFSGRFCECFTDDTRHD